MRSILSQSLRYKYWCVNAQKQQYNHLGYWQHNLHIVLLDVEPVSEPGALGVVGEIDVLLQLVRVEVLVLDVPHQQTALP